MLRLKGIPPLVNLLRSPSPQVQQTASAALRNLAFKDADNKEVVQRCGGITEALALLRDTDSTETQKQLTGREHYSISVHNTSPSSDITEC